METNLAGQVCQVVFHRVPEHIEIDFRIPVDGAVSHAGESSPGDLADCSGRRIRQRFGRPADFGDDVRPRTAPVVTTSTRQLITSSSASVIRSIVTRPVPAGTSTSRSMSEPSDSFHRVRSG